MLKAAWTLAIETLSWIELRGLSERSALNKAAKQLDVRDARVIGLTHKMVHETVRRNNLIDFILSSALKPRALSDFTLGVRAFLRLYVYETRLDGGSFEKGANIARMGRSILGWRALQALASRPHVPLWLGYGSEDRFAGGHALMAAVLAPHQVTTLAGGHDWPTWLRLWQHYLELSRTRN